MNVSLTPKMEDIIREKVASGMYGNASEVIREALRRYLVQENLEHRHRAFLRDIKDGEATLRAGNYSTRKISDLIAAKIISDLKSPVHA